MLAPEIEWTFWKASVWHPCSSGPHLSSTLSFLDVVSWSIIANGIYSNLSKSNSGHSMGPPLAKKAISMSFRWNHIKYQTRSNAVRQSVGCVCVHLVCKLADKNVFIIDSSFGLSLKGGVGNLIQ